MYMYSHTYYNYMYMYVFNYHLMSHVLVYILATGTGPTVLKIKTMKGVDGTPLNIVQKIAAGDYMTFGMCLLQDENGHEVELIERNHSHKGVERVTLAIIIKWLTSGQPLLIHINT